MHMGRLPLLALVAVIVIFISFPQGSAARRIQLMRHHELQKKDSIWRGREMMEMETLDYPEPGANTNPRTGGFFAIPPPPFD